MFTLCHPLPSVHPLEQELVTSRQFSHNSTGSQCSAEVWNGLHCTITMMNWFFVFYFRFYCRHFLLLLVSYHFVSTSTPLKWAITSTIEIVNAMLHIVLFKPSSSLPRNIVCSSLLLREFCICLNYNWPRLEASCIFSLLIGISSNTTLRRSKFVADYRIIIK